MKNLKTMILFSFLLTGAIAKANWPARVYEGEKRNLFPESKLSSTPRCTAALSSTYLTGCVKKEEHRIALLQWDCKLRWRLNRNLSLIISYN